MPGLHALQKIKTRNLTTRETMKSAPLPQFLREMVELGGQKPYFKARLAHMQEARS